VRSQDPAVLGTILSAGALALAVSLAEIAMAAAGLVLARPFFDAGPRQLGIAAVPTSKQLIQGLTIGFALWVLSAVLGSVQAKLFGDHPQVASQLFGLHHDALSIVYDFLGACIVAPVCEELFFRGIVFAALVQRMPVIAAACLSGVIFSAAHADLWAFFPRAVIGIGLAYFYYYTKSLWPNIFAHFTVNTTSLILIHAFPQLAK
jgi:membrane protease YdiL (CAAX protease family)